MNVCRSFIFMLLVLPVLADLQGQDWESVEIKSTALTEQVYMLQGVGGNIGILIGDDYVFMIDGQFAELNAKINTEINALTEKPLQFLLNTQSSSVACQLFIASDNPMAGYENRQSI